MHVWTFGTIVHKEWYWCPTSVSNFRWPVFLDSVSIFSSILVFKNDVEPLLLRSLRYLIVSPGVVVNVRHVLLLIEFLYVVLLLIAHSWLVTLAHRTPFLPVWLVVTFFHFLTPEYWCRCCLHSCVLRQPVVKQSLCRWGTVSWVDNFLQQFTSTVEYKSRICRSISPFFLHTQCHPIICV